MNSLIKKRNRYTRRDMCMIIILLLAVVMGVVYMLSLYSLARSFSLDECDILAFIKVFELILALMAIGSCMLCYNSTGKEEIFIVSLMYIVLFLDILMGNLDNISLTSEKLNQENYIAFATSMLRVCILLTISFENSLKRWIIKNKTKSILIIIVITICLNFALCKFFVWQLIKIDKFFICYNLFLIIIYVFTSIVLLLKSIKSGEYIYSVVGASIFFLMIKALYAISAVIASSPNIKLLSISITYIVFITTIGGVVLELISNISKNRELEKELMIFKDIVDNNKFNSIILYDSNGCAIYANKKLKDYIGASNRCSSDVLDLLLRKDSDIIGANLLSDITESMYSSGYWKGDIEIFESKKTYRFNIQNVYPFRDKYTVAIINDITEQLITEEQLMEYEKMKNQEEVRTEFFANISHELRTPLNIFNSTLQLLDRNNESNPLELSKVYSRHSNCLKTNYQRMSKLINNIVDITKLDIGFMSINFENIDIVRTVEGLSMSIINYAKQKNIDLVFDTEVEEHVIKCDYHMIERIMLNLLSNAIKFTEVNGNIEVYLSVSNDWVHIRVRDNGVGIPIEIQSFIFDRFVRSDKSLSRMNEGSGIGLSLVKSAVVALNGAIYLDSDGYNGTEFEIMLPNESIDGESVKMEYEINSENIERELSDIYEIKNLLNNS